MSTTQHGYKVLINSVCEESQHSNEAYGDWYERFSNSFSYIRRDNNDKYPDVNSIHNIPVGAECVVVWLEYSSGDSFGHSDRGSTEVVGVFPYSGLGDAQAVREALLGKANYKGYEFNFEAADGQTFHYGFALWRGYFETLDEVHVETTTMVGEA